MHSIMSANSPGRECADGERYLQILALSMTPKHGSLSAVETNAPETQVWGELLHMRDARLRLPGRTPPACLPACAAPPG